MLNGERVQMHFDLPAQLRRYLKSVAARRDCSMADLLTRAVRLVIAEDSLKDEGRRGDRRLAAA